jgi:phosphate starvation-inducible PhoH-like protein
MFKSFFEGNNIIANGSAGTGKTFSALYLALNQILSKDTPQNKIVIVRSAVASREIGHLPGSQEEKLEPYEAPYKDILFELITTGSPNTYDDMKEANIINFMPSSFIRGLTWDNSVVVVDEIQNMNFHEINSIMTRLGDNSIVIMIGDHVQTDLYRSKTDKSGIQKFLKVARGMSQFDEITFTKHDIVRSELVKSWICALEDSELDQELAR